MPKYDVRGYRLVKWRWIYIWMLVYALLFGAFNISVSGTVGLLLVPTFALVFGWQLGCVSERNDWQRWYETRAGRKQSKESTNV